MTLENVNLIIAREIRAISLEEILSALRLSASTNRQAAYVFE